MPHLTNAHRPHVPPPAPITSLVWLGIQGAGRLGGGTESVSREKEGDHIWTTDWARGRARGGGVENRLTWMNHCPNTHTHTPSPHLPFPTACCTLQHPLPYSCQPPPHFFLKHSDIDVVTVRSTHTDSHTHAVSNLISILYPSQQRKLKEGYINTPFISTEFAFVHAWKFQINLKERPAVMFVLL